MKIISNMNTLRALERRGYIKLPKECGTVSRGFLGGTHKHSYVNDGPALRRWFEKFKLGKRTFQLRYVDGCFFPFVAEINSK